MQASLTSLFELDGVRGAFVFDQKGQIVQAKTHSIYDQELLRTASAALEKSIEALQTHHGGWDSIVVHYTEGKVILRGLGPMALAVIADASINLAFLNVAVNVAVKKLTQIIEKGDVALASAPTIEPGASSGLSSSGLGTSGMAVVMDQETTDFVNRCIKALAKAVGPMAKVFVKEVLRSTAQSGRFSREQIPQLVRALEERIDGSDEKARFRRDLGM